MSEHAFLALIPPATAEVECGGETHRIRWADGHLSAVDHGDPEGERTLAALGGTTNGCIDVLDAWTRRKHELRALTIASRGPADPLNFDRDSGHSGFMAFSPLTARRRPFLRGARPSVRGAASSSSIRRGFASYSGVARATVVGRSAGITSKPPIDPGDDYTTLFSLSGGLPERVAATVAAHWSERIEVGETSAADEPALYAALASRVWTGVRSWTGEAAEPEVRMIGPATQPSAELEEGRWILAVPFRWLSRVWAPGLALTANRLVLDAQLDGRALQLATLERGSGRIARMTLDL